MLDYPLGEFAGNRDTYLWDDAATLIEENKRLRSGEFGLKPWPSHLYFLGHAGGSDVLAIDLRATAAPVWWVDHLQLDAPSSGQVHDSFDSWLEEFVRQLIHELEADGICPPDELRASYHRSARQHVGCFLLWIVAIGLSSFAGLA